MSASKCSVNECKRDFDTLCVDCEKNFCTRHYIEHAKLANDELISLADQLNSIIDTMQQFDPLHRTFQQLEQWRDNSHRQIDDICNRKKRQLQNKVEEQTDQQMKELRGLTQQVKELIAEGDASFKQVKKIRKAIEDCHEQCQALERVDYLHLNLKPIEINISIDDEIFFVGGQLLSVEHQLKLNEFYGKQYQKWILIYKATRNGFQAHDFHRCCDNQGPTMTIIQSNTGGYLFGGYTSVPWKSIGWYAEDTSGAFLFTLINPHGFSPTKYAMKNSKDAIYDHAMYGPTFGGGHDLYIANNSQNGTTSHCNFPLSYTDTTNRGNTTFAGRSNFGTSEIEVYRLLLK